MSSAGQIYGDDDNGRKLRVIVITMGGPRQEYIRSLFASTPFCDYFEPPTFSPGVRSRGLRNRFEFFRICQDAGLIPELEWEAIQKAQDDPKYKEHPENFFDCFENVPAGNNRRGSLEDQRVHYSVELWRKAKGLNRGRAVLACTLAHLIALKRFTADGHFDVLLEDNVRCPSAPVTARCIQQGRLACHSYECATGNICHMRYFGWLGSILNLEWIFRSHIPKRSHRRNIENINYPNLDHIPFNLTVVSFPTTQHIEEDLGVTEEEQDAPYRSEMAHETEEIPSKTAHHRHNKPGGTPVWGCYAYWMSKEGYEAVLDVLRSDVGAMLFKNKRARCYTVKPVDKIFPRQLLNRFGPNAVQLVTHPAFFRAPMLTSQIHSQWDPEFCKSSEYQLQQTGLSWDDLNLTPVEKRVVNHRNKSGQWVTPARLEEINLQHDVVAGDAA